LFYFVILQGKKAEVLEYVYEVRTSQQKAVQYLADASPLQLLLLDANGHVLGTAAGREFSLSLSSY
jgi:hypothetical protein